MQNASETASNQGSRPLKLNPFAKLSGDLNKKSTVAPNSNEPADFVKNSTSVPSDIHQTSTKRANPFATSNKIVKAGGKLMKNQY